MTHGGKRPGSGPKPRAGAPRNALLSLRVSEDEMGWLAARGRPAEVVRELIAAERRREGLTMYAAIGSDGTRMVVWGIGTTEDGALAEGARWADEAHPAPALEVVEITAAQRVRIEAGEVDWAALSVRG